MSWLRWLLGILVLILLGAFGLGRAVLNDLVYEPDPTRAEIQDGWPFEEKLLTTKDGETLISWWMAPVENCPVLLMFHGNGGHIQGPQEQYARIRDSGAGMLAVSWRGYAGSTGTPSERGLHLDARAAYDFLRGQNVPADRIVIHGFSLGSGPATRLAADVDVAALVLEAPYLSTQKIAEDRVPYLPIGLILRDTYRSDKRIPDVDEPILMVHGSVDAVIPARHSEMLATLATASVQREVFQGSDHNSLVQDGLYEKAVWPFLKPKYPGCPFTVENEVAPL